MVFKFRTTTEKVRSFHWAEPIIADELGFLYSKFESGREREVTTLLDQHFRMWHFALQKKNREAERLHEAVISKAADFGISEQSIASINDAVVRLLATLYTTVRFAQ